MMPTDTPRDASSPPDDRRPVVIYDGDCGFCKWLLAYLLAWDREGQLRPLPLGTAEADALLADLSPEERNASWHLIESDGTRHSGGPAIPRLLRDLPAGAPAAALFAALPGPTDRGYRWVAAHRTQLSRFVPSSLKRSASERVARAQAETNPRSSRASATG